MPILYSEKSAFIVAMEQGTFCSKTYLFQHFFFFWGGGLPLLEYTFASFCDRLDASHRTLLMQSHQKILIQLFTGPAQLSSETEMNLSAVERYGRKEEVQMLAIVIYVACTEQIHPTNLTDKFKIWMASCQSRIQHFDHVPKILYE